MVLESVLLLLTGCLLRVWVRFLWFPICFYAFFLVFLYISMFFFVYFLYRYVLIFIFRKLVFWFAVFLIGYCVTFLGGGCVGERRGSEYDFSLSFWLVLSDLERLVCLRSLGL